MKRVIIVHCWGGYPEYCWYQNTKKELEAKGFEVIVPAFPDTNEPNLNKWLPVLSEAVGDSVDEETYLIGHSVGCITILRYLESLNESQKVGGVVLVAGFTDNLSFDELKNFFTTDILFEKIKENANHFVAIHSDNDPYVPLKHGDIFKEKLNAELIIKHEAGHFSGSDDEDDPDTNCTELPIVIESIIKIS